MPGRSAAFSCRAHCPNTALPGRSVAAIGAGFLCVAVLSALANTLPAVP